MNSILLGCAVWDAQGKHLGEQLHADAIAACLPQGQQKICALEGARQGVIVVFSAVGSPETGCWRELHDWGGVMACHLLCVCVSVGVQSEALD